MTSESTLFNISFMANIPTVKKLFNVLGLLIADENGTNREFWKELNKLLLKYRITFVGKGGVMNEVLRIDKQQERQ